MFQTKKLKNDYSKLKVVWCERPNQNCISSISFSLEEILTTLHLAGFDTFIRWRMFEEIRPRCFLQIFFTMSTKKTAEVVKEIYGFLEQLPTCKMAHQFSNLFSKWQHILLVKLVHKCKTNLDLCGFLKLSEPHPAKDL